MSEVINRGKYGFVVRWHHTKPYPYESAMPDKETAQQCAAASDMAEALSDCDWLLRNLHAKTNSLEAQKEIMQCAETIRAALTKAGL